MNTGFILKNTLRNQIRFNSSSTKYSTSYVQAVLSGQNAFEVIFPFPQFKNNERMKELEPIFDSIHRFIQNENDPKKNDEKGYVDEKLLSSLKELGVFGLQVPEEYNGLSLNNTEFAKTLEKCSSDLGLSVMLGAHQSIGYKGILLFGNDQQKAKYLPKLATGEHMAAFALTEHSAGSDANSIKSRATLSADGSHYILNGSKIWISNGDVAKIFTVFAQTEVNGKDNVTAFIVDRDFGGITNGPSEKKMGIKCVHSVVVNFDNVKIPKENVLGEVGKGFKVAMEILNSGRFGMGAIMSSLQKDLLKKSMETVLARKQFGKPLIEFKDVQHKLSVMAADTLISESMAYTISHSMDNKVKVELEAAICKIFASEAAWRTCDETIQLHGGMGYMAETDLERIMRDLRIFRIFEGTNDILRFLIVLTAFRKMESGMISLLKASLFNNEIKVAPQLQENAKKLVNLQRKLAKTTLYNLTKYKKGIKDEQVIIRNLADAVINLYGASTVLSRFNQKQNITKDELKLINFTTNLCCLRFDEAIKGIDYYQSKDNDVEGIVEKLKEANGLFTIFD